MEHVWRCTRDLLDEEGGAFAEARHAVLALLRALADAQGERLGVMRTVLFRYLRETHPNHAPEDALPRFRLLHAMTNNGKNITCFEEQVGGRCAAPARLSAPAMSTGAFSPSDRSVSRRVVASDPAPAVASGVPAAFDQRGEVQRELAGRGRRARDRGGGVRRVLRPRIGGRGGRRRGAAGGRGLVLAAAAHRAARLRHHAGVHR